MSCNQLGLGGNGSNGVLTICNKFGSEEGYYPTFGLKLGLWDDGRTHFFLAPKSRDGTETGQYWIEDVIVEPGKVYDLKTIVTEDSVYVFVDGQLKKSIPFAEEKTLGGFHTGASSGLGRFLDGAEHWYTQLQVLGPPNYSLFLPLVSR